MANSKTNDKYWNDRTIRHSKFETLKKITANLPYPISSLFFSVNLGPELWIVKNIRKSNCKSCLDIACGAGFRFAPYVDCKFYGVDIEAAPLDSCKSNYGYANAKPYDDGYEIPYDEKFDCGICVDLNAHVSDEIYISILKKAFANIKPGGSTFLVLEVNNDGLCYKYFKNHDNDRFNTFVKNAHHNNFNYYSHLEKILNENEFRIKNTKAIIGPFIPTSHIYAYYGKNKSIKAIDGIFSIMNYFLRNKRNSYLLGVEICQSPARA